MALGADWCNAARGFMFAVGCIQSQSCHTDRCPTGVATQDPTRQRALVVPDKIERVANFHRATLHELAEMTAAAGLDHPQRVQADPHLAPHLAQRGRDLRRHAIPRWPRASSCRPGIRAGAALGPGERHSFGAMA